MCSVPIVWIKTKITKLFACLRQKIRDINVCVANIMSAWRILEQQTTTKHPRVSLPYNQAMDQYVPFIWNPKIHTQAEWNDNNTN